MKCLISWPICGAIALASSLIACAQISSEMTRTIRRVEASQTPVKLLVSGLFYADEIIEITDASRCKLPTSRDLASWMEESGEEPDFHGFYWIAPKAREVGFAEYVHLPSMKTVDFGANIFRAHLLLVCKNSDLYPY